MLFSKKITKPLLILLLGLTVASCSKFNKLLKSSDTEAKYTAAMKYYEKKDYVKAGQLFDDLLQIYRGTLRAEEVYYYYTYCKYHMAEIPTAAFHFRNFYETYPNSKYAEECFFRYAYCVFVEAYPYNLDPSFTYKAIDEFQLFVNVYPQSQYVARCNELIDECRLRLKTKAYKTAKLYYNIEDYKAAMVSFQNLIKDFPDLGEKEREESEFLIIKAAYKYAEQSIEKKQEERFGEVIKAYKSYSDQYPKGQYINEAKEYSFKAQKKIEELGFSKITADFKVAEQSPKDEQLKHYKELVKTVDEFLRQFPQGHFIEEAKKYAEKAKTKVDELTK